MPGFWPDIEKSRAEARRLLKEAGAEGLKFELLNRNVDQPYKFVGTWVIGEWKKIGLNVEQKVVPTGPWFSNMRGGTFDVVLLLGVLYHLRDPLEVLERVRSVTKTLLVLETEVGMLLTRRPAAEFLRATEFNDDPTNWWAPNVPAMVGMKTLKWLR